MLGAVNEKVSLDEKLAAFADLWAPQTVATLNDYDVRLVKLQGAFVWHSHPETDELFLVLSGHLRIEFRQGAVDLGPRDLYVVPKGVEHRPVAEEEVHVLLVEPSTTVNTGTAGGERTAPRRLL
jgi:mannose-6-phosphate isomerase-like protein (cupin superfamily)